MGKNKLAKFAELDSLKQVVQVSFNNPAQADHPMKGNWNSQFFGNNNPLVLELGCGKGEYTVKMALQYPEKNFIGVDIKGARMWRGAKQVNEQQIPNAGFLRLNIEFADKLFAPNEVDEIWLTFPDPQMKKTTRRLTATNFMANYRRFLKPGGIIHLKTDSNFQYQYTLAMAQKNQFDIVANTDDLYHSSTLNEELSIQTFYEKQWLDRGLTIKYLAFKIKQDIELFEPDEEIEKDPYRSFGRSARI